ncbi:MAG: glycosyltransferase family 39 protein [bacterium]|nr:glycosyltransferase family 39 protein [bacterium]
MTTVLAAAALILYLAGNGRISLWDRDEPRFAQATRQMIESDDWVVPRFNEDNRYDKPVLIYWLMSVPMRLLGVNEISARMPAALAGAATTALVHRLALALGCGPAGALLAALMTMSSALLFGIAKAATTDAVLTLTIVAMMRLLWRQRQGPFSWIRHCAIYAILGASVLVKGPPGPLVLATAVAGEGAWRAWRERRGYRPDIKAIFRRWAVGWLVFLAVALPWAVLAWRRTGGEYFAMALGHHVLERSLKPLESHGGKSLLFLFYYFPVLAAGLFPWFAPALLGLRHAWVRRGEASWRFLWCWLVPSYIVFSLVRTKLPHYIAPLLPAAALMAGLWWDAPRGGGAVRLEATRGWWRAGAVVTAILGALTGAGLVGIAVYLAWRPLLAPAVLAGIVIIGGSVAGGGLWWRRRAGSAIAAWAGMMAVGGLVVFTWALPSIEPLRISKNLTAWVARHAPPGTRLLGAEYREPSLVFYWSAPVEMLGNSHPEKALERLRDPKTPTALIAPLDRWNKWKRLLPELNRPPISIRYQGRYYLFHRGRWTDMVVVGNW